MDGMTQAVVGIRRANQAQGDAIDAVIAATHHALGLFSPPDRDLQKP